MREPLVWKLAGAANASPAAVLEILRAAAAGPRATDWTPPPWLMTHQVSAAQRIAESLRVFGGGLLADAVGLGKTYTALAVAARYPSASIVVPAILQPQWRKIVSILGLNAVIQSHEGLSRGIPLTTADLVIVDEAHRFRNPSTKRYDRLARDLGSADVLLVTATPVVNSVHDLRALLRLFLSDAALAVLGVPTLDGARSQQDLENLQRAIAPLLVARSFESSGLFEGRLPQVHDHEIIELPTVSAQRVEALVRLVDGLQFPSFQSSSETALLRSHLLHRLASSALAFQRTLRRHLAYMDRAIAAAEHGEHLTRVEARRIFGPGDELQFELGLTCSRDTIGLTALQDERQRLVDLLAVLNGCLAHDPKASRLTQLIRHRAAKTIVFTTATTTAWYLGHRLAWNKTAVVTGRGATIANGRCAVTQVLDLFAPNARRASAPPAHLSVVTLIATDVASEGLDLQDADAVVHYDIPWTPLRLAQRLGRVRRLGAAHRTAHVWWFGAVPLLDDRLGLRNRLQKKLLAQLGTGVVTTSNIGRSTVGSRALLARELFCRDAASSTGSKRIVGVVCGPHIVMAAVRWRTRHGSIPELLALQGPHYGLVQDFADIRRLAIRLDRSANSRAAPPAAAWAALRAMLRQRLRWASAGPYSTPGTMRLSRQVLDHARTAGEHRRSDRVELLDRVLERVSTGLRIGRERELTDLLPRYPEVDLDTWCTRPDAAPQVVDFSVDAVLFGDGSRPI